MEAGEFFAELLLSKSIKFAVSSRLEVGVAVYVSVFAKRVI